MDNNTSISFLPVTFGKRRFGSRGTYHKRRIKKSRGTYQMIDYSIDLPYTSDHFGLSPITLSVGHLCLSPDGEYEYFVSLGGVYRSKVSNDLSRGYRDNAEFVGLYIDYGINVL